MTVDLKYDLEIIICIRGTNLEISLRQRVSLSWFNTERHTRCLSQEQHPSVGHSTKLWDEIVDREHDTLYQCLGVIASLQKYQRNILTL